jgi:predicted dehydrogenase
MSKLRVGIIGTGHLGAFHARVYSMIASNPKNNVAFVGVCDICEERAKEIAEKYGTKHFNDYKDMLDIVDAVSIVVPTSLHHMVARDFLKAGVHVLVEKPMTKTLEEADELIKLAAKKNLALQVGHIERFNSAVRAIEPYLAKPTFIECQRLGSIKRKGRIKDVGVVLDLMIHDIDIILSLVNSKVKNMVAFGASTVSEHEDIANVRITFENNVIADITASRVTKEEVRKLRIFQEDSYLLLDYMTHEAFLFKKSRKSGKDLKKTKLRIKKHDALEVELASFLECVRENKRPIVSGIEGRQALKVGLDILDKINGRV